MNSSAHPETAASAAQDAAGSTLQRLLRISALVVLFSAGAAYESAHLSALNVPEVWIHLRTGTWILENHAIPRTGLFSQDPSLPWSDSTWGFDLLLGVAYRIFGLRAFPLVLMVMKASVAVMVFLLARAGRAGFWSAIALSALAQYVISAMQPLPYVFSILCFAIELQLLVSSRLTGTARGLYWLPLLFVFWANLHMQFVVGLILLALLLIALVIEQWLSTLHVPWLSQRILPLPVGRVSVIAALSCLATFVTPYGYRLFVEFFKSSYTKVAFQHFSEMSAMSFRRPQDYALMLLIMMAFLALGRRRSLELFELLILLAGTAVAFRVQRDGWMVVLAAVAVLSMSPVLEHRANQSPRMKVREWSAVAAVTALVLAIAGSRLPDGNVLWSRISQSFPVKACDYITANKLPAPLFNEYAWGSFLTWYLPAYPVVVDSRVELYGDRILSEYFDIVGGKERLDSHPMIARAGTLLLGRNSAMTKALMNLPGLRAQYRLVYSDEIACVFVPAN